MNLVAKLALGARLLADRWNDFLEGTRAHIASTYVGLVCYLLNSDGWVSQGGSQQKTRI